MPLPRPLDGFAALAPHYHAVFCDVWGVIHDGKKASPPACAALQKFRAGGGKVILLSNAPRPSAAAREQLRAFGVPDDAFDGFITSGDCCHAALAQGEFGRVMAHLGPLRDLPLLDGLGLTRIPFARASKILCTGLKDDTREDERDYQPALQALAKRGGLFLCANPDLVVMRGEERVPCAGALAKSFAAMGGEVVQFGKPYPPIYEAARALLPRGAANILAIGDGAETDIAGAVAQGLDSLFITSGIARAQLGDAPSPEAVAGFCPNPPNAFMTSLKW